MPSSVRARVPWPPDAEDPLTNDELTMIGPLRVPAMAYAGSLVAWSGEHGANRSQFGFDPCELLFDALFPVSAMWELKENIFCSSRSP